MARLVCWALIAGPVAFVFIGLLAVAYRTH
jgi:hypothetical protein